MLVTGFGPFPGVPRNPASTLACAVAADRGLARTGIATACHVFETSYRAVDAELADLVRRVEPVAVLMIGVASRRKALSVEVRALNRVSILFADVSGQRPQSLALEKGAPPARKGRAPMSALVRDGRAVGHDTRLSSSAGRYLCNYSYWRMLGALGGAPCLFLHIPKARDRRHLMRMQAAAVAMARRLALAGRRRSS